MTDDLDRDQPPPWFPSYHGWRRFFVERMPETQSEAEEMAMRAYTYAWKAGFSAGSGASHDSHPDAR